jgi:hypothetical protein
VNQLTPQERKPRHYPSCPSKFCWEDFPKSAAAADELLLLNSVRGCGVFRNHLPGSFSELLETLSFILLPSAKLQIVPVLEVCWTFLENHDFFPSKYCATFGTLKFFAQNISRASTIYKPVRNTHCDVLVEAQLGNKGVSFPHLTF